ncbi:MAG: Asp-tRNA(Asn)/Glu-tRNA(Gln) amidotransferase subunit GatB [Candidatus Paceibacterota bacterium]
MYKTTIGLEIHCELKTKSKMFCDSPNNPDETRPNFNVCPVCLGHPGTLPVINREAVKAVIKLGLAVAGKIPSVSRFDRKSYFYPDLPKGYQISQYKQPLVEGGSLNGVKITRIHLEEDTGTLSHDNENHALVDFNRAGVPLMELVTEPDIKSGEEAVAFAKELQLILRYLGISEANMEKGQMRVEVNISLSQNHEMGTKVEIKNLNSFKAVKEAADYEIKRQTEILEEGNQIVHETRGWDDAKRITVSQRSKEKAHDYRYFPEPDLPPLDLTKFNLKELKESLPELPAEKRSRLSGDYGLTPAQAEILVENIDATAYYFVTAAKELKNQKSDTKYQALFNYLTSDLFGLMTENGTTIKDLKIKPKQLAELIILIIENKISSRIAKDVLSEMYKNGLDPRQIIEEKGLSQISDEEIIGKTIKEVIAANPAALADYQKGKANALQFLIGQAMGKLRGQANPEILRKLFEDFLSK